MPFAIQDSLRQKCNERQIREIHEREYSKYISNLRQQSFGNDMCHLSEEHIKEMERSKLRNMCSRKIQYDRIKRQNDILSERLFKANQRAMVDHMNTNYRQNLDIFNQKYVQQRLSDYKRINNENQILMKRFNNARGQLTTKEQCEQDWQHHIGVMKKSCDYPENIDEFVSNVNKYQHRHVCPWANRYSLSRSTSNLSEIHSLF